MKLWKNERKERKGKENTADGDTAEGKARNMIQAAENVRPGRENTSQL